MMVAEGLESSDSFVLDAELFETKSSLPLNNRALSRGRSDWIAWQLASAARFASRTAAAVGRVIRAAAAVSRILVSHRLLFGVGSRTSGLPNGLCASTVLRRH